MCPLLTIAALLSAPGGWVRGQDAADQARWSAVVARLEGGLEPSKVAGGWRVSFYEKPISDDELRHLVGMPNLTELNLSRTRVSERGLALLPRFPRLKRLDLMGLRISDAGLVPLRELKDLQQLNLEGNHVTDAGLPLLKELPDLRWLTLTRNRITDQGLQTLRELPKLQTVSLGDNRLSEPAVRAFQEARPDVRVFFYFAKERQRQVAWTGLAVMVPLGGGLFALGFWMFRTSLRKPDADPSVRGRAFFWGLGLMLVPVLLLVMTVMRLLGFSATLSDLSEFL